MDVESYCHHIMMDEEYKLVLVHPVCTLVQVCLTVSVPLGQFEVATNLVLVENIEHAFTFH